MGWMFSNAPEHEGYLIGIVQQDELRWRELGFDDEARARGRRYGIPLSMIQVGCDCGWRSPRIAAPFGTYWSPFIVNTREEFEEEMRERWREHVELEHWR